MNLVVHLLTIVAWFVAAEYFGDDLNLPILAFVFVMLGLLWMAFSWESMWDDVHRIIGRGRGRR